MPSTTPGSTSSVERAIAIVEVVAAASESVGVSVIARRCDLPKSTVVRLLRTLEDREIVERVDVAGGYRLGSGLVRLVAGAPVPGQIRDVARPLLRALVDALGEDVGLAVADGSRMLFVDQVSCESPVQVPDWSGQRIPYHAAAAGYVLLAGMEHADLDRLIAGGLEPWMPRTVTDEDEVRRRVERARETGTAWVHEEWAQGINGVAAPVRDPAGRTVAAINLYGPSYRFPGTAPEGAIAAEVVATADRISEALQRSWPDADRGPQAGGA